MKYKEKRFYLRRRVVISISNNWDAECQQVVFLPSLLIFNTKKSIDFSAYFLLWGIDVTYIKRGKL